MEHFKNENQEEDDKINDEMALKEEVDAQDKPPVSSSDLNTEQPPTNIPDQQIANPEWAKEDVNPAAEYDASEEIAKESNKAMPAIRPPSPQEQQLSKYQQFMSDYKDLQDQRQKGLLTAGLFQAGGQIGQAVAGKYSGNFKPDESGIETMKALANQPVADFENAQVVKGRGITLQSEMDDHDPKSPKSKMIRDYLNQKIPGLKLADDVSAADAQQLLKNIGKPTQTKFSQLPMVNKHTGEKIMGTFNPTTNTFQDTEGHPLNSREWVRDYRAQTIVDPKTKERFGFSAGTGKLSGQLTGPGENAPIVPEKPGDLQSGENIQLNRSFLNGKQAEQVDHTREKFIQEVKDDRNSLNANDRVISVLQQGGQLGDLPREIQDQLNRSFGQKGHISDAQLGGLLGKPDWKNRFQNAVSLGMTGKLTDENRKFLLDVANMIKQQNQSYIDKKSQIYSNNLYSDLKSAPNLQKYKFGPDAARNLLGVESAVNPDGPQAKQDPKIVEFAKTQTSGDYNMAKKALIKRGYVPQE